MEHSTWLELYRFKNNSYLIVNQIYNTKKCEAVTWNSQNLKCELRIMSWQTKEEVKSYFVHKYRDKRRQSFGRF